MPEGSVKRQIPYQESQHRTSIIIDCQQPAATSLTYLDQDDAAQIFPLDGTDEAQLILDIVAFLRSVQTDAALITPSTIGNATYDYLILDGVVIWIAFYDVTCMHWVQSASENVKRSFMILPQDASSKTHAIGVTQFGFNPL